MRLSRGRSWPGLFFFFFLEAVTENEAETEAMLLLDWVCDDPRLTRMWRWGTDEGDPAGV